MMIIAAITVLNIITDSPSWSDLPLDISLLQTELQAALNTSCRDDEAQIMERIKWNNLSQAIFRIHSLPQFIFKSFDCPDRFDNSEIARSVLEQHSFKHIIVPRCYLLKIQLDWGNQRGETTIDVVAEEWFDIEDPAEDRLFHFEGREEVINELAKFILTTGLNDCKPDNYPFLKTDQNKVVLVDLEKFIHPDKLIEDFAEFIANPYYQKDIREYFEKIGVSLESEEAIHIYGRLDKALAVSAGFFEFIQDIPISNRENLIREYFEKMDESSEGKEAVNIYGSFLKKYCCPKQELAQIEDVREFILALFTFRES